MRVSRSVEAFMVVQGNGRGHLELFLSLDDVVAEEGMRLHDLELLRGELARRAEDRVQDAHLADVVHGREDLDVLAVFLVHAVLAREHLGEKPDPLHVVSRVVVPEFREIGYRLIELDAASHGDLVRDSHVDGKADNAREPAPFVVNPVDEKVHPHECAVLLAVDKLSPPASHAGILDRGPKLAEGGVVLEDAYPQVLVNLSPGLSTCGFLPISSSRSNP
jgi:hypothetical protein